MKKTLFFVLIVALYVNLSSISAQIQTGVFRTPAGNTDYHHFTRNNSTTSNAAVFINQESTAGSILRLSGGTPTFNQNVRFSFESNGNFGIGTTSINEKMVLYSGDTVNVFSQYANTKTTLGPAKGLVVGVDKDGNGRILHRGSFPIIFGTYYVDRMKINSDGVVDFYSNIQAYGFITPVDNSRHSHFVANNKYFAAVQINQVDTIGPILRLSSRIATANQNVQATFANNGNLGIGVDNAPERISLRTGSNAQAFIQFIHPSKAYITAGDKSFVVGIDSSGHGKIWHRGVLPISFGTNNAERMKINTNGIIDVSGTIQSVTGGYKIDTTGLIQAKAFRTVANNTGHHHFASNGGTYAAVYIN